HQWTLLYTYRCSCRTRALHSFPTRRSSDLGSVADSGSASVDLGSPSGDIEGWAEGMEGAQQGATRVFVLPPDLGYAEQSGNPLASDSIVVVAEVTGVS